MESRGAHQFKRKTPKNSPPQVPIPNKPKPIVTPNHEVDFIYSSTQFENTKVHLESHLECTYGIYQLIIYIDIFPNLVPNFQIQQVHEIIQSYSLALD